MEINTLPPPTKTKTVFWETNFNNKLACSAFIHIDLKPHSLPLRKELDESIIEIYTKDNSHPPVTAKLLDLMPASLHNIPGCFSIPSHGLTGQEFESWFFDHYSNRLQQSTDVCIYFYKKI